MSSLSLHGLNPLGGYGVRTGRKVFTAVTFSQFVHTVRAPLKILSVLTYVLPDMLSISTYERTQMPRPYITEKLFNLKILRKKLLKLRNIQFKPTMHVHCSLATIAARTERFARNEALKRVQNRTVLRVRTLKTENVFCVVFYVNCCATLCIVTVVQKFHKEV